MWQALVGAAIGAALGQHRNKEQVEANNKKRDYEANRDRWAFATGRGGQHVGAHDQMGTIMQGLVQGASMGQGVQDYGMKRNMGSGAMSMGGGQQAPQNAPQASLYGNGRQPQGWVSGTGQQGPMTEDEYYYYQNRRR